LIFHLIRTLRTQGCKKQQSPNKGAPLTKMTPKVTNSFKKFYHKYTHENNPKVKTYQKIADKNTQSIKDHPSAQKHQF
jgi:hypothetical protein